MDDGEIDDSGWVETPSEKKKTIRVKAGHLDWTASFGELALIESGMPIYQRGRQMVRPIAMEVPASKGRTVIAAGLSNLTTPAMVDRLCQVAIWEKYDGRSKSWVRIDPPSTVAATILSRSGEWRVPPISGIITTPTLRPDGTLLTAPGYDPQTRLYHFSDPKLDITKNLPTQLDRAAAERALLDLQFLLQGFPTVTPVDHAVALSGLISPVCRGALSVVPMHAFRASTAGSGKTFLVDVASTLATGRPCPVATVAKNEEETEKRLGGLLLAAFPVVCLDNVNGELGGDLLCQAIERPIVQIRPLGASDIIEIESRASMFATGNAMRVRGDMTRRTLIADLDAQMERPELREFPMNPVEEIMADRGRYVAACLTIVLAHANAGHPGLSQLPPLNSFEDWSKTVRAALIWLGCADPCASMETARADDPELSELTETLDAWVSEFGAVVSLTAGEIVAMIAERYAPEENQDGPGGYRHPLMREIVLRIASGRGGIETKRLGNWLKSKDGRISQGRRFRQAGKANGGVTRWQVQTV